MVRLEDIWVLAYTRGSERFQFLYGTIGSKVNAEGLPELVEFQLELALVNAPITTTGLPELVEFQFLYGTIGRLTEFLALA